tara:strand:+ start:15649 stop:16395 length:747 start_codon:yes stop_codon:yes gene_type:complete
MHSTSSTSIKTTKKTNIIPQHVAIIMDGNGRWARTRLLPRMAGHKHGVESVRTTVKACIKHKINYLTLYAFSSENWRRPIEEISFLMELFTSVLDQEVIKLHENGIRFKVIGDLTKFDKKTIKFIRDGEKMTASNTRLTLTIAANYGGRWDIMQAIQKMCKKDLGLINKFAEKDLYQFFSMNYAPEPDLFIRTGGEQRISNFLLWQLAYTELYFTDTLWPDFNAESFDLAIKSYQQRERRFGRTSEQL